MIPQLHGETGWQAVLYLELSVNITVFVFVLFCYVPKHLSRGRATDVRVGVCVSPQSYANSRPV